MTAGHDTSCVCGHSLAEHKTPGAECAHSSEPMVACGCVTFRVADGAGHDNTRAPSEEQEVGGDRVAWCNPPLRCAYADPPYPGQSKRHYGNHPDYAGEVDHARLVYELVTGYDGYCLHTSSVALADVLRRFQIETNDMPRVMAWVKPFAAFKRNVPVAYAWEPVLVQAARKPVVSARMTYRDFCSEPITMQRGLVGAKPERVCQWLFAVMGLEDGDELVDLYPGSGAVTRAWDAWRGQTRLAV